MTTIVMVEKKNRVEIAFDSKVSSGHSTDSLEQPKVFKNNGIVYGVAGAVRFANEIELVNVQPPAEDVTGSDLDKWVQSVLIPRLQVAGAKCDPVGAFWSEMQMLVAVNHRVYMIGSDFSRVRLTSGLYAIGSGSPYAMSALEHGKTAKEAVEYAGRKDPWSGFEVKTMVA